MQKSADNIIAVIGQGRDCTPELIRLAEEVGTEIAQHRVILICGGLGGIMEAASRGAKNAGGLTIGVLPGTAKRDANPYIDIPIVTGMSEARNVIITRTADAVIAVGGFYGTLSEIAFSLAFGKPVVGLRTWEIDENIHHVETAEEAVELAIKVIRDK
ncbi:TIGR00725 family protein [candidate division KSB1 bacterium]|nr:TIGR00725 family protein [candidate division KSB1 bacterium]